MSTTRCWVVAVIASAAGVLPASAAAETTPYHPAENARIFNDGAGGWTERTESSGACVQDLTCPTVTSSWQASGGTRGGSDGHLRVQIDNLAGVESMTRSTWRSPAFEYRGAGGDEPGELTIELARRADLSALANAESSATYSVEVVKASTGVGRTVVDTAPLGSVEGWTRTRRIDVKPSSLEVGADYRIQITATFHTTARVFQGSFVDFDDVRLRATDSRGDGDGAGGNGGADGSNGANGGNGADGAAAGNGSAGGAVLQGKRLFLRLKCLGVARKGRCKVRAVAYASKKGARTTFPIERRVRAKKGKKVTLRVRPRFARELSKKKKVLVRSQIKAGGERKTKFRRYRLTKRR
jgi:hypothetical protein